jgi:hypothetical protein
MTPQQINHYLCGALREYDEEKMQQHLLVMLAEIAEHLARLTIVLGAQPDAAASLIRRP